MRPSTRGTARRPNGAAFHMKASAKSKLAPAGEAEVDDPRLAAIVRSSDDPIMAKDMGGVVFAWNMAAERLFGYTAYEMVGHPLTAIFPPDRMQEETFILGQIARGERVEHYETTRRCKDGRLVRISASVSPIWDANGGVIGASKIVRDLTDHDARDKHIQRLTELGLIVTTLVHEVSQPITAIRNYLGACRRLTATGTKSGLQPALEQMENQAKRASEIIERIRDFVMKREVQMQPEDLSLVIDEAVALIRTEMADEVPMLAVQVDPAEPRVDIDKVQVQQVQFNLMRNGIEAMKDQSDRKLTIATQRAQGGMVEISVADNGAGLPENVRSRLFQPFVTTKPTGMGVGLSMCQGIVELHGGRLWAEDRIGRGTVFRFTVRRPGEETPVARA